MKTFSVFASAVLAAGVLVAAAPAHADVSYQTYRRAVLGDSTVAAPTNAAATRNQMVPGSYAQYLINNGANKSEAIVAAARIGEYVGYRKVAVETPQRQLTPAQAYVKYLGNDQLGAHVNEPVTSAE